MRPDELVKRYLSEQHMMQLATMAGDQPWCCTVYFVADDAGNLYWASLPSRRHSQEIVAHNKVAAAIPVKFIKGEKVVGIQIEGTAQETPVGEAIRPVAELYAAKFGRDAAWVDDFTAGHTEHRLYRLTPHAIVLFDEEHFSDSPRQTVAR